MNKKIVLTGLVFGAVAIILGAFGAHGLKKVLSTEQLNSFETGVKYLVYHAFFLLFLGNTSFMEMKHKKTVYFLTLFGAVLFSLSIILLTTGSISGINFKFLGPITPIGGLLLILAWGLSFYYISIKKD